MKTVWMWLLSLAAIVVTAPLCAEQMNAPGPHGNSASVAESATVNWARVAEVAQNVAPTPTADGSAQPTSAPPAPPVQPGVVQSSQIESQHQKAEEQIREQEKQRVLGVVPAFNTSYRSDAVSLTAGQKVRLAFRSATDPVTFGVAFVVAGYHEVANDLNFGWGVKGYGQRAGAAYLDTFDGTMIGNGILPALLHQDPRYFRKGRGTTTHRLLYAAATSFICKHDNTGKWEPNYSNIGGNIIAGAISNLYYPGTDSGVGLTISNGMIVTAEGAFGAIFQEFWPDISRKLFHKDPTHGRDTQISTTADPPLAQPSANKQ